MTHDEELADDVKKRDLDTIDITIPKDAPPCFYDGGLHTLENIRSIISHMIKHHKEVSDDALNKLPKNDKEKDKLEEEEHHSIFATFLAFSGTVTGLETLGQRVGEQVDILKELKLLSIGSPPQ
jgi:hypothetical protein